MILPEIFRSGRRRRIIRLQFEANKFSIHSSCSSPGLDKQVSSIEKKHNPLPNMISEPQMTVHKNVVLTLQQIFYLKIADGKWDDKAQI